MAAAAGASKSLERNSIVSADPCAGRDRDCQQQIEQRPGSQGLPDFFGRIYQNGGKIPNGYNILKMAITYTKWPKHIPNGLSIYQLDITYTNWTQHIPNGHNIYQNVGHLCNFYVYIFGIF
jgi:hypothetical protein